MSDKPTELDLIKLELRDIIASQGEMRMSLNAMWRQVTRQQEQINELREQVELLKAERHTMTGSIQGLEGEFTISSLILDEWTETATQVQGEDGFTPPPRCEGDLPKLTYGQFWGGIARERPEWIKPEILDELLTSPEFEPHPNFEKGKRLA